MYLDEGPVLLLHAERETLWGCWVWGVNTRGGCLQGVGGGRAGERDWGGD